MNEILIKMHVLLLQILSNGAYKSVLHRVRVNSTRPRMSVASFHSLPAERVVGPAPELVDEAAGKPRGIGFLVLGYHGRGYPSPLYVHRDMCQIKMVF